MNDYEQIEFTCFLCRFSAGVFLDPWSSTAPRNDCRRFAHTSVAISVVGCIGDTWHFLCDFSLDGTDGYEKKAGQFIVAQKKASNEPIGLTTLLTYNQVAKP